MSSTDGFRVLREMNNSKMLRRGALPAIIILSIFVPCAVFGSQIESWSEYFLANSNVADTATAPAVIVLLESDVLLPIPKVRRR